MIIDKERVRKRSKFFNSSASGQTEEEAYGRRDPRLARWRGAPKGRLRVQLVNETHLGTDQYFPFKKSCQNIFELFSTCQQFFYSSKQQQSQHVVSGTVNRIQSALHRTWLKYRTILNNSVHLKPIQAAIGRQESTQNWKMSTQNIGRGLKTHLTLYNYTSVSLKLFLHVLTDTQIRSAVTKTKGKKNAADFQEESGCREARKSLFKRFTASI